MLSEEASEGAQVIADLLPTHLVEVRLTLAFAETVVATSLLQILLSMMHLIDISCHVD